MNDLTCAQFEGAVHGFVRTEMPDMSFREAVIEHAAHCDTCAYRMSQVSALAEALERAERAKTLGGRLGGKA